MKVLFAVNDEKDAEAIINVYQKEFKEIVSSKTVYYFNAIIKELQKDKSYDRIVISEDLEMFSSDNYQAVDKFIFEKMDAISDEATNADGNDIPIILLCMDRRTKSDPLLVKLFGLGLYNVLVGQDRNIQKVVNLMYKPRSKKEAKLYYKVEAENVTYSSEEDNGGVRESEIQNILTHYKKIGNNIPKCVKSFDSIVSQYSTDQVKIIIGSLPNSVRVILEENSDSYRKIMGIQGEKATGSSELRKNEYVEKEIDLGNKMTQPVIIPTAVSVKKTVKGQDSEALKRRRELALAKKKAEEEARLAREKAKAEAEAKRKEEERLAKEKARKEAEAKKKEEERLAREKAKAEAEAKRKEEERLAREKARKEAEAKKKEEERLAREKAKAEAEAKRKEEERLAREKAKKEAEAKKKEEERLAREKAKKEAEAKKKEEERLAREKAKKEAEAKKKEEERLAREKAKKEAEAKKKEEERLAREKAKKEAEAKKKEEERLAREKAKKEAEAKKKEEERLAKEKAEAEAKKKENSENQTVKRGRGRPRKNPIIDEVLEDVPVKKKRGRPRKNIENEEDVVEKVEEKAENNKVEEKIINPVVLDDNDDFEFEIPDFDDEDVEVPGFDDVEDDDDYNDDLSEFDDFEDETEDSSESNESTVEEEGNNDNIDEDDFIDFEDDESEDEELPGFEDEENNEDDDFIDFEDDENEDEELPGFEDEENNEDDDFIDFEDDENEDEELPGFEDEENNEDDDFIDFEDDESEDEELPGFEEEENNEDDDFIDFEDDENEDEELPGVEDEENNEDDDFIDFEDEENEDEELPGVEDEENNEDDDFIDFEDDENEDEGLPGFENNENDIEEDNSDLIDLEDDENDLEDLPNINDELENSINDDEVEIQHNGTFKGINNKNYRYDDNLANSIKGLNEVEEAKTYNVDTDNLITSDQKIVAFVGTAKNGTSFIVNNLAELYSNKGIKTAILDLTQNKNSYYIYTNNEDSLRERAHNCFDKLKQGVAEGIEVNKNLSVYTSLPNQDSSLDDVTSIIQTLLQNYTIVLLDCDFDTDVRYFRVAQEMYLIQSLDVLTIQPLTAFLRDLKVKNILETNKLRIVINKNIRVNLLNEKVLIKGMSSYNDPSMTYMTELFNADTIKYVSIPFESQVYVKYLEGLVNCKISSKGYSKNFISSLNKLGDMVYPTINGKKQKNDFNNYSNQNAFSKNTNSILDRMKKKL